MTQPSNQQTKNQRRAQWQQHIAAWQRSGQTRAAYCEQNGLKLQTFAYWRKRLKVEVRPVTLVQLPTCEPLNQHPAALRIVVDGCFTIEVADGFTSSTLARTIEVVRSL